MKAVKARADQQTGERPFPDRRGETLTGSEIIWEALVREHTEVVFGYPGVSCLVVWERLPCREAKRLVHSNPSPGFGHSARSKSFIF